MTTDPYTMEARLCDDNGMVSRERVEPPNVFNPDLTYLGQLNNLRARTYPRGEHKPVTEPFHCTGSAHQAGEHVRCTSPAHIKRATTLYDQGEWEVRYDYLDLPYGYTAITVMRSTPTWSIRTYDLAVEFAHACLVLKMIREQMLDYAYELAFGKPVFRMPEQGELYGLD